MRGIQSKPQLDVLSSTAPGPASLPIGPAPLSPASKPGLQNRVDEVLQKSGPAVGVHWWTAATRCSEDDVRRVMGGLSRADTPGGFGHPWRRVHESGAAVYCGSRVKGQPVVINAPGEVCELWALQLAGWSADLGAWVTRVDLANDVEPAGLARKRLRSMHRAWRSGSCETTMRRQSCELIVNDAEDAGWTLYLGGRSSELRWRVYDRRGPLRIEGQWRPARDVGNVVPELLLNNGPDHLWRSLARPTLGFKMPWLRELIDGPAAGIWHEPRVSALLDDVLQQFNEQWGLTLWALGQLGLQLDDLQTIPKRLRGSQAAKFLSWAASAGRRGYDGERLRREVLKRCQEPK